MIVFRFMLLLIDFQTHVYGVSHIIVYLNVINDGSSPIPVIIRRRRRSCTMQYSAFSYSSHAFMKEKSIAWIRFYIGHCPGLTPAPSFHEKIS